jgi:hypothetical protein
MIKGYLDRIDNYLIQGWCFDSDKTDQRMTVSLYLDSKLIAKKRAEIFRVDLLEISHPTGYCGFVIEIPRDIDYLGQKIEVLAGGIKLKSRYRQLLKSNELIDRIQLYGERASGTNFLMALLQKNFPNIVITDEFGWKHFFPPENFQGSDNSLFIVIYRDPFDWIRSLYLQPNHVHHSLRKIGFSEFIRKEWYCIYTKLAGINRSDESYGKEMMFERDPKTGERFENVLQLRSAKILAFEAIRRKVKYCKYIRYEVLNANPLKFLNEISAQFQIGLVPEFIPVNNYKGFSKKTFVPKKYFSISTSDLKFIKMNLICTLENRIGYRFKFRYLKLVLKNLRFQYSRKIIQKVKDIICWHRFYELNFFLLIINWEM